MQDWKARLKDVALRIEDAIESKIIDSFRGGQGTIPLPQSFHYTLQHAIGELTKKFVKEDLQMKELKSGACKGQRWKVSGGGFPKLKSLLIQGMELKQWTATDEDDFPILERIIIKHCIHLEKIPSTFVELYTLQLFELYGCQSLLVHFAKQIQQQQEELFGYNWLVVHDYNTHQVATIIEEKERVKRGKFDEQEHEKVATIIIEEKEQANRGQQECKKLKYKASYPDSSYFARQVQEEEVSKLTNVNFFINCFEDDFDNNDIN
nr:putative late blight resistance protein homolog R1B-16 isoform X1 [Ipomoea batatas]